MKTEKYKIYIFCFEDGFRVAKLLVENGAEVNVATSRNWTPMMCAAANGKYDWCCERIWIKISDFIRETSCLGNFELAKLLIENGAEVNVNPDFNSPPLVLAAAKGKRKCNY